MLDVLAQQEGTHWSQWPRSTLRDITFEACFASAHSVQGRLHAIFTS